MKKLSRDEIKKRRKYFINEAKRVTHIRAGDRRIATGSRICTLCGRSLSSQKRSTGETFASVNHIHCYFNELLIVNLCEDATSCYRRHERS
ncbi:hypothetical protein [Listeria phage P100plus]|uniref:Uncharacterized protein n=14 Tax=Pecentumvirus TaxID=1857844 RepID=W0G8M5_9CAUD|nr:gp71 [Listeria phage A511]YP_007676730.1 hypothetical protein AG2_063 [Listeria phage vB_LmoM_AG20]YP_008997830.1 hypothetical protein QLX35_gp179 [Listeria phage LP-125]YP_009042878.1 hypothetical protein LP048_070 [Listeria phage LP-048]YP_009044541.1 hypothetical protein LP083-2_085 [Listeria phage LP-083-2]YP_009592618.1 hypothetical protein FDG78_gp178 [Listeria phage LP-064]YP_009784518.1 hypothetical protein QLX40_gp006 [Listeria phage LP-124]YP_010843793.1 membrane protein [Lister